ncbi:MAG: hypothetical protein M1834_008321 [Cirrosporium novae-zelandiae]|nr:MAG: hypothetical protein M1834_008321 [Cirrosporium novae-zelandiae]
MVVAVQVNSPLASALATAVQPKLVDAGWSSADDNTLAEYIILMLVNGKTQDEIATDLAKDLLQLPADDPGASEFASWLFEQVESINHQINGPSQDQNANAQSDLQAIPSYTDNDNSRGTRQDSRQDGDTDMADTTNGHDVPTGPKAMRNNNGRKGSNNNKRLMGQLSKAMDRSNDSALHRVRPQSGNERINMHSREPPKGPRSMQGRIQKMANRPAPLMGGFPNAPMPNGPMATPFLNMSVQQQQNMQEFYKGMIEKMTESMLTGQPPMLPGMPTPPGMNMNFLNGGFQPQGGRSLFDRVDNHPKQNGHFSKRGSHNGQGHHHVDTPMSETTKQDSNVDTASSMDVEGPQPANESSTPPEDIVCRFNLSCTKADCKFAHQSPAAPPGTAIDPHDNCTFGAACKNRKCTGRHPSPAQRANFQAEQDCKFFPNCTNKNCPFRHPQSKTLCKFGAECNRSDCPFLHMNKIPCRFDPCLKPDCPYQHTEGQKRGTFADKVWTADQMKEAEHVSERKFIADENAEEELIKPDAGGVGFKPVEATTVTADIE